jgi:glycosyltransferase involved in cell wall biosynthesis
MRILMVTARYLPFIGGTEIHTYETARRMAAAGHDVTVLTTDPGGSLTTCEHTEGVGVVRVPAWPANRDYYFAPEIYSTIMAGEWDLIHLQGYHTFVAPLAMLAAYRSQIPYVVTFHSGGHPSRLRNSLRGLQRWMLRPLLVQAEKLIGVSDFETNFFMKHLHQPSSHFVTISNGSYLPKAPAVRAKSEEMHIVSVGRLERYKGHHRTIMALPKVLHHYPDAKLSIIGAGPYELELWQLAKNCGVAKSVKIGALPISERDQLASILAEASLAILLSDYESQGIAILEALSLGIPALVTHTSGLADLAKGGLVRSVPLDSNSDTIAEAILEQLRRPLIVPNIQLPSWENCTANLLQLYEEVHGQKMLNQLSVEPNSLRQPGSHYLPGVNRPSHLS